MVETATASLAAHACSLGWHNAPPDVRERLTFAVKDVVACAVGGAATDLALIHRRALGAPAADQATLIGSGARTTTAAAAYHNATAANALDFDDTAAASGHPGSALLGTVLALGQTLDVKGEVFLDAMLTGYETVARVALACRPSTERYDQVHGSQSFLAFGTAAAAGRLIGLSPEGMVLAFGIAAAMAPVPAAGKFGWDEAQLSWIKDNVNQPAEIGLRAALLAAQGFPASRTVLDGDRGFWRMVASDRYDPAYLMDGERFHLRDLAFKPYPCCRWLHAILKAVEIAIAEAGEPEIERLSRVDIETIGAVARVFGSRRPLTMVDAQFSAPHAVAATLLGIPRTDWWRAETRDGVRCLRLMDTVTLAEEPRMSEAFLAAGRNVNRIPARVRLTLGDGRSYSAECAAPSGTPGRDLSPKQQNAEAEQFGRKHRELLATGLDAASVSELLEAIADLPQASDLSGLVGLLAKVRHPTILAVRRQP